VIVWYRMSDLPPDHLARIVMEDTNAWTLRLIYRDGRIIEYRR
jgi:hypothetical protein